MALFNNFPYTDLNDINLDYTLQKLESLYTRGEQLYSTLTTWQQATDAELEQWKAATESSLALWKTQTENSIDNKIQLLTAAINAAFTELRTQLEAHITEIETAAVNAASAASASATAAAGSASDAADSATAAAGSASDAEDTAESLSDSLDQIAANTSDITDLKIAISQSNNNTISYTIGGTGHCIKYADGTISSEDLPDFGWTDYVDISKYTFIAYKRTKHTISSPIVGMAFYDASKTYISGVQAAKNQSSIGYETNLYKVGVPGTAVYARFTTYADTATYGTFAVTGDPKIYNQFNADSDATKTIVDYAYKNIPTFVTWANAGIAESGQLQNDSTKGRTILTLPVYSDMIASVSCDDDVEYRLFYYQIGTDANAAHFVRSTDYTQSAAILECGYSYKILARYKASPSSAISDINTFGAKIHSYIHRKKEYIEDIYPTAKNLYNKDDTDIIENGYIDRYGDQISSTAYFETGYIPCSDLDTFNLAHWDIGSTHSLVVTFYTANKTRAGEIHSYTVPFEIPGYQNIRYFRMAMNVDYRNSLVIYKNINGNLGENVPYNNFDFLLNNGKQSLYETISNQWLDKKWYAYGTSLTSTSQGTYAPYLAKFSGSVLYNKGIPGGGICADTRVKSAIMNTTDGKLEADLITLEVGANEASATLGTIYDTGDSTFCGALNQCIQYLQENTTAQIVVMSSTAAVYAPDDPTTPYPPSHVYPGGWTKHEMNTAIREVCECNGVYYIPMGDGIGYGYARVKDDTTYRVDQIHHSALGGYNIAKGIWGYLKNIPLWYSVLPS